MNPQIQTIDDYVTSFPKEVQALLEKMRVTIQKAAPQAQEKMSYGIPTFTLNGNLVHFGAFKSHIGFYPGPAGIMAFKKDLAPFETSKGAIQFPLDRPLPLALVTKIVRFRAKQNLSKKPKQKAR